MREGWTYKKLGEVGDIITGSTPSTQHEDNYNSNDVCFIKPSDIPKEGVGLLSDSEFYISNKAYNNSRKLPIGSVLTTCIGIIGKVAILNVDATCNQQINAIIPYPNVSSSFIAYTILSKRHYLEHIANAPVVPIINKKQFSNTIISVPPLSEQERIVSELDLLSGIIEKKKAQLKEYDKLAQSIFYDMFGDPVTNEKGWEVKKMGEVCEYAKTRVRSESITTYNYVGVDNLLQNCQGKTMATKVPDSLGLTEYWQGDVLIGNIRPYLKKIWLATEKGGCNGDVLAIRRKEEFGETINTMFLLKCLSTDRFFDFAMQFAKGEKMPRGDKKEIMKFIIPLPPLPLQQTFASKIEAIERQKALIQQTITETETLFNSRMDYYFD